MNVDLRKIEEKWQKIWKKEKLFEPKRETSKAKYFITVPYPYINGLPHLGHGFTFSRGEFLARYKRMKGLNVLWPQGWHATGAPIVGAALQVKEGNPKWINTLRSYKIPEDEIRKFSNPEYWVFYFSKRFREAFEKAGFSIDWRREFYTTYLNKAYSKFIEWQYRKLKEKGLIAKGKHPVVWDPKVQKVIGDHDRPDDYVGISPMEVVLIKFHDDKGRIYPCATFRPETVYGVTNLWIREDGSYVEVKVDNEVWIVSKDVVEEISDQLHKVEVLREIKATDLLGKIVKNPVTGENIPILPASFVNTEIGTGIVMSVPAHAPYDWVALQDLKKTEKWKKIAETIKPKSLIELEGFSEFPARDICEKMGIKSQADREKLEDATKEIYNKEFYNGILKEIFGKYAGKRVFEIKEKLIEDFVNKKIALKHYILPIRFKSRYGGKVHVKIITNQWFLRYSDPEWKKLAHKCVEKMKTIPDEIKQVLHQNIDWMRDWAFTHQKELGTPLPWDRNWTIESLSDSTIYMAYYTIAKFLQHPEKYGIKIENLDDEFFDYVFLGKGKAERIAEKIGIEESLLEEIRKEFEYWYPVDIRISAKDLLWNHLIFFILHHVAIFKEDKWPKTISINGYVTIDGEKMSKSKGNVIPLEFAVDKNSADVVRFILAYAGNSGMDDANIEISKSETIKKELLDWYEFATKNYGKGRSEKRSIDEWFEAVIHKTLKEVEEEYENLNFKNVIIKAYYNLENNFRWYHKRTQGNYNSSVISQYIEIRSLMLYPIIPHLVSEILEKIKGIEFALKPSWPPFKEVDENALKSEEFVKNILEDINHIKRIIKKEKFKTVKIILPAKWKYELFDRIKEEMKKMEKPENLLRLLKDFKERPSAKKIILKVIKNPGIVSFYLNYEKEKKIISEAKEFFETEFNTQVIIEDEESSEEEKAKNSLPGKPAIVIF